MADRVSARVCTAIAEEARRDMVASQGRGTNLNATAYDVVSKTAAASPTLEEKQPHQKRQHELEAKHSTLRRELFVRQDNIKIQHNDLITQLEVQFQQ